MIGKGFSNLFLVQFIKDEILTSMIEMVNLMKKILNNTPKIKCFLIVSSVINFISLIWFVLGTTSNFNRGIDLATTILFFYPVLPSIPMLIASIYLIIIVKDESMTTFKSYLSKMLPIGLLLISIPLILNVNTSGWLTKNIKQDLKQITIDGKYEYCMQLVNLFQKNSYARLYLKDTGSEKGIYILLDIPTREIGGLSLDKFFSRLEPTPDSNIYKLITTNESPFPEIQYHLYIREQEAERIINSK